VATLRIKNFLSIDSAEIEVRRVNVFIGPQAQGKSLIVKLIYFFESMVRDALLEVVPGDRTIPSLKKENLERFEDYFPKYAWGTQSFEIVYEHEHICVSIARKGVRKNNPASIALHPTFEALLNELRETFDKLMQQHDPVLQRVQPRGLTRRTTLLETLKKQPFVNRFIVNSVFVPASRAFFANIEKNVFTLISNRFEIDRFMAEFGSTLERIRQALLFRARSRSRKKNRGATVTESGWDSIIRGDYVFDDDEERIQSGSRVVKLSNSSSGQQEAIPLLLVLSHIDLLGLHVSGAGGESANVIIEEPEAHLFPRAQSEMARLITSTLNKNLRNRTVFTTHSPYMLTAMNNLAFAGKLYGRLAQEPNDGVRRKLVEIVPESLAIRPEQLRAYKVEHGKVDPIIDSSTDLINAYLVDQASEEFGAEFTKLLEVDAMLKHVRGSGERR
jgi:hypothetical protein